LAVEPRLDAERAPQRARLHVAPQLPEALQDELVAILEGRALVVARIASAHHRAEASGLAEAAGHAGRRLVEAERLVALKLGKVFGVEIVGGELQVRLPAPLRGQEMIVLPDDAPARGVEALLGLLRPVVEPPDE